MPFTNKLVRARKGQQWGLDKFRRIKQSVANLDNYMLLPKSEIDI